MTEQEFLRKYGIKTTFEKMRKSSGYLTSSGNALVRKTEMSAEQTRYIENLDFMFTKFMDAQLTLKGRDLIKDVSNFKLDDFVKDFENVMCETSTDDIREPYEGMELAAIDTVRYISERYNRSMRDCLKDKVKSGASLWAFYKQTAYDKKNSSGDERAESAKAAGTMYRVMKDVISERTWGYRLNPLNWWSIITENLYMMSLKSQLTSHTYTHKIESSVNYSGARSTVDPKTRERAMKEAIKGVKAPTESEIESFASGNSYDYIEIVAAYQIEELDNYRNERAMELPESNGWKVDEEKVGMSVIEASSDFDKSVETADLYENRPSRVSDVSLDSSM